MVDGLLFILGRALGVGIDYHRAQRAQRKNCMGWALGSIQLMMARMNTDTRE